MHIYIETLLDEVRIFKLLVDPNDTNSITKCRILNQEGLIFVYTEILACKIDVKDKNKTKQLT